MSCLTQVTGIPKKPDRKKQNGNQDFCPGVQFSKNQQGETSYA